MKCTKCILVLILTVILFSSCGMKPNSWETESMIAVMADNQDWERLEPELSRVFERVIRTPQKETTYTLHHVLEEDFNRYTKYKYLVLAATLESEGKVGNIVKKVVSNPAIRAEVENGDRFFIVQENQWANGQYMIILVGKDIDSLSDIIAANSNLIYDALDEVVKKRMKVEMFKRRQQKSVERRLMSTYNWTINLQHDYFIPQEFPQEGFLWFRRILPERWIFVRWIDGGDESLLNEQWVIGERNRIGATYYGGDSTEDEFLFSFKSEFLGRPAQITTGLWGNNYKMAGGPFKNYTFYDKFTKRVYMIDVAVHAPERNKLPYMKRLDIIAHTFRTVFDMEVE